MYTHHKFDHEFDWPSKPAVCYVVCSVPRSGSSLLCELLCNTGVAGVPTEYFDRTQFEEFSRIWGATDFDGFVTKLVAKKTTPNGVFGFKAHQHQYAEAFAGRDARDVFPNLRFVSITRKDHLAQAISYARAVQTEQWASTHGTTTERPRFDFREIRDRLRQIESEELAWESFFAREKIIPYRVAYEDLVPPYHRQITGVLRFLGVEPEGDVCRVPVTLEKQGDRLSVRWARRYRLVERFGPATSRWPIRPRILWHWLNLMDRVEGRSVPSRP